MVNDSRFDGNTISDLKMRHGGMRSNNYTSGFVAEDIVVCHYYRTDAPFIPEVNV